MLKQKKSIIIAAAAGVIVGLVAICLSLDFSSTGLAAWANDKGNPGNMAFCIACFIRDTAGALGLHSAAKVQYLRPEIIGIVLGAFIIGLAKKDFAPKGGSSPFTRFILGICVMVGALVFLGCPLRMVLRMGGGDINALIGLVGFVAGIGTGIVFLNFGFTLKRSHDQPVLEGTGMSIVSVALLILAIAAPAFIIASTEGPGSLHAPLIISLAAGLIIGVVGQRSRLCFVGGFRDAFLFKDFRLLISFGAILVVVIIGNLIRGKFKLGMEGQPIAHTQVIWNILGLYLVGFGSVLLGGCPFRQLILAGSGSSDAAVTVLGFVAGAAICHNFGLASSADGTTANGRIAFVVCALVIFAIAFLNTKKSSLTQGVTA